MVKQRLIIDCHCHGGKGDGLTGPWDTNAALDKYLQRAARVGIDRTVVFSAFHSDYQYANRVVARIVKSRPNRLFGFAFIHPHRDRGRVQRLASEAVLQHGFLGLKVHRHDARITREICEVARNMALPILYDVTGEISAVRLLGQEYPEVPFIIPHLGSFADDWRAQQAFIDHLSRFPNIFTDTSGVRRFDLLEEAVERAGAHKILFGSDGPWLHPGVELSKVYALRLAREEEQLILGKNFIRIIRSLRHRPKMRKRIMKAGRQQATQRFRDPWQGQHAPRL